MNGHRSDAEAEKGALPVPWNWIEVCFWELAPAWRSVAVKTDSSGDRSLKFISASQGGSILSSSTVPLTAWRDSAFFFALGSPNTRSMLAGMKFPSAGMASRCPGPSHKCQYTGTQSCLGESIWTNMRSSPDNTSAPSKGSLQSSAGYHESEQYIRTGLLAPNHHFEGCHHHQALR